MSRRSLTNRISTVSSWKRCCSSLHLLTLHSQFVAPRRHLEIVSSASPTSDRDPPYRYHPASLVFIRTPYIAPGWPTVTMRYLIFLLLSIRTPHHSDPCHSRCDCFDFYARSGLSTMYYSQMFGLSMSLPTLSTSEDLADPQNVLSRKWQSRVHSDSVPDQKNWSSSNSQKRCIFQDRECISDRRDGG